MPRPKVRIEAYLAGVVKPSRRVRHRSELRPAGQLRVDDVLLRDRHAFQLDPPVAELRFRHEHDFAGRIDRRRVNLPDDLARERGRGAVPGRAQHTQPPGTAFQQGACPGPVLGPGQVDQRQRVVGTGTHREPHLHGGARPEGPRKARHRVALPDQHHRRPARRHQGQDIIEGADQSRARDDMPIRADGPVEDQVVVRPDEVFVRQDDLQAGCGLGVGRGRPKIERRETEEEGGQLPDSKTHGSTLWIVKVTTGGPVAVMVSPRPGPPSAGRRRGRGRASASQTDPPEGESRTFRFRLGCEYLPSRG